ncbi:MAG: ArnT family glycosyltransferase [Pseudomonadota bacterium]
MSVDAPRPASLWIACVLCKLLIFALAGRQYGYLSDELYFMDAARHLDLGYVDFPPMIAWVIALTEATIGTDLLVLRGIAVAAGIAVTLLAVETARQLGGGRLAQWITGIVVLFAPAFLSVQSILTMNVLDQLWWTLGFWLLVQYLNTGRASLMLWLGLVYGLALLTKLSLPFWFAGMVVATALFRRDLVRVPETWAAIVIMLIIAAPFFYWQISNNWPFLAFITAYADSTPEAMVINQPVFGLVATMNPPFALIWLPGLIYGLLFARGSARFLATAATVCLVLFLAAGVKFYFATPLFVIFTALGAILWERWLAGKAWLRRGVIATLVFSGLTSVPIGAPVLPPDQLQALVNFMRDGEQGYGSDEPAPLGRYFPHFAEMGGWVELVDAVTDQYLSIPGGERANVTLLAAYYGQAGALNQLDRGNQLPTAYSGHMNYGRWWEQADLSNVLAVGYDLALLQDLYEQVEVVASFSCERCMARENGLLIVRAQSPRLAPDTIRARLVRLSFF